VVEGQRRGHGGTLHARRGREGDGNREGLLFALIGAVGVEDDGAALLVLVLHEAGALEVVNESGLALDAGVGDLALLFRVELAPLLVIELLVKGLKRCAADKIDERIAHVAFVLEVDGQVEKIVSALVLLVHSSKQHFLAVLVGNVANHEGRALVEPLAYSLHIKNVLGLVFLLGLLVVGLSRLGILAGCVRILTWCVLILAGCVLVLARSVLILAGSMGVLAGCVLILSRSVLVLAGCVCVLSWGVLIQVWGVLVLEGVLRSLLKRGRKLEGARRL
jgi:hypothetical protein